MVRTQIQLTESQVKALRQLSACTRRSIADLTREALDQYLEQDRAATQEALVENALQVAGRFASGLHDVSTDHDRYIAEALRD
jgi:hypothetical protein